MYCIYFHNWHLLNWIYLKWDFLIHCRINGCRRRRNLCIGISCIIKIIEVRTGSASHDAIIIEHSHVDARIIQLKGCCNIQWTKMPKWKAWSSTTQLKLKHNKIPLMPYQIAHDRRIFLASKTLYTHR